MQTGFLYGKRFDSAGTTGILTTTGTGAEADCKDIALSIVVNRQPPPAPSLHPSSSSQPTTHPASGSSRPSSEPSFSPTPTPTISSPTQLPTTASLPSHTRSSSAEYPSSQPSSKLSPRPSSEPSFSPTISSPTQLPTTPSPTPLPTTATLTPLPTTANPTPLPTTAAPTPLPTQPKIKHCGNDGEWKNKDGCKYPLLECTGDCNRDRDCAGDLVCYQRGPYEAVPGCSGGEQGASKTDYCVRPTGL